VQVVFQTTDRAEVEAYCAASGTEFSWSGRDGLHTAPCGGRWRGIRGPGRGLVQPRPHVARLDAAAEVAEYLLAEFGPDGVPRNACYGDGQPIEDE
jgi:hypothetical protein